MAVIDVAGGQLWHRPPNTKRPSARARQQPRWQRAILELLGTFLALMGIAAGILTLRFALVLMHGMVH
jgi:hypothetical protein